MNYKLIRRKSALHIFFQVYHTTCFRKTIREKRKKKKKDPRPQNFINIQRHCFLCPYVYLFFHFTRQMKTFTFLLYGKKETHDTFLVYK